MSHQVSEVPNVPDDAVANGELGLAAPAPCLKLAALAAAAANVAATSLANPGGLEVLLGVLDAAEATAAVPAACTAEPPDAVGPEVLCVDDVVP